MGQIHLAIVEDELSFRITLRGYLKRFAAEKGLDFDITEFSDASALIRAYRPGNYDILLMDILMPGINGMAAAVTIRKRDADVAFMFITSSPQYAIKGWEVDAFDYILKPLSYFALSQRLERAIKRLTMRKASAFLQFKTVESILRVDLRELRYIEVKDHDLSFHLGGTTETVRETIKNIEKKIAETGSSFVRINKGILVNLAWIEAIQTDTVRVDGTELPLSRVHRRELFDAYNNYWNEVRK
jgi:DNA-binding LytR/AlgR family response regulator